MNNQKQSDRKKIKIVGNGVFGTFLKILLNDFVCFDDEADTVILAVPSHAIDKVASEHKGKHLVNVCSVQRDTNESCLKHTKKLTGIHPLFGKRSPASERNCILTHECVDSYEVLEIFKNIGATIITHLSSGSRGGERIDGKLHDKIMAQTHLVAVEVGEKFSEKLRRADWIPNECLPASVKKLREVIFQLGDMPKGTLDSIKANPFIHKV
jgi:hypothetical protein